MLKFIFNIRSFTCLFLISFIVSTYPISSDYRELAELYRKDNVYTEEALGKIRQISKSEYSQSHFAKYLLYKYAKHSNRNEMSLDLLDELYSRSYIKDREMTHDYIRMLILHKKINRAMEVIESEKVYIPMLKYTEYYWIWVFTKMYLSGMVSLMTGRSDVYTG
ncbi:MAG: hypothetical protein ACOCWO_06115 [Candidatus Muiribacteriaceae bacterium]